MVRQRWILSGLACALLAAGCGAAPADSPEVSGSEAVQPAAVADAACRNGAPLPITGLCNTADPSLFLAVDDTIETFATRCLWRTEEVQLSADEVLVFRAQDCSPEGWVRTVYSHVSGYLKHRMDGTPEDQAGFALQVFPLATGETAEQAAMKTLELAPEVERDRCETKPNTAAPLAGRTFDLEPKPDYMTELEAGADGLFSACGPNGFTNEAVQVWEGRSNVALFHMLGQDTPPWDPASFTFYRRAADGRWAKAF